MNKSQNDDFVFFTFLGFFMLLFFTPLILVCINIVFKTIQSRRVGKITRTPIIPFTQEDFQEFEEDQSRKSYIPEARIFCSPQSNSSSFQSRLIRGNPYEKIRSIMRMALKIKKVSSASSYTDQFRYEHPVPNDACLVSIKMENFQHGLRCHDFEPIDGTAPGSYYTYQMFGDNRIQVTNYVENGISYVAGFCIYIEKNSLPESYREKFIKDFINSRKYVERSKRSELNKTNESENIIEEHPKIIFKKGTKASLFKSKESTSNHLSSSEKEINEWTIKNCPRLQRLVMTGMISGTIVHQEWNHNENRMKMEKCEVCSEQIDKDSLPTYSSLSIV